MHILVVADGRSPTTRRWIQGLLALKQQVTLISTYPCAEVPGTEHTHILPVAFGAYREARGDADFTELKKMLKVLRIFNWTVYPWRWILSADVSRAYSATDFLLKTEL